MKQIPAINNPAKAPSQAQVSRVKAKVMGEVGRNSLSMTGANGQSIKTPSRKPAGITIKNQASSGDGGPGKGQAAATPSVKAAKPSRPTGLGGAMSIKMNRSGVDKTGLAKNKANVRARLLSTD